MKREITLKRNARVDGEIKLAGDVVTVPNRDADFLVTTGRALEGAIEKAKKRGRPKKEKSGDDD